MSVIKKIQNFQVLTPTGWSDFDGVSINQTKVLFKLEFNDGTDLQCTPGHLIMYPNEEFLEACYVLEGDELHGGKIVTSVEYCELDIDYPVLDLINVSEKNQYLTNDVVSHNCAFVEGAEELWASLQQTLSTGGQGIILSTPNGTGNFFHKTWVKAESGDNKFKTKRLPWQVHPERDQAWRDRQDEELGPRLAAQECDCDFSTSGNTVISPDLITYYRQTYMQDPLEKRGFDGNLWVWELADYTKDYIVCADVARGDGSDYSAFHIIDVESCRQVAEYRGQVGTKDYGNMLVAIATEYNDALLVVENANVGWATLQQIIDRGYKNLYYTYKDDVLDSDKFLIKGYDLQNKSNMVAGFTMSSKTRPLAISKLELYVREKSCIIRSNRLLEELFVFIWKSGRAEAAQGYNDDLIMSFCSGLWVRDTALKLRQAGIEINRAALSNIKSSVSIYKPSNSRNEWGMDAPNGTREDITWLL